MAADTSRHLFGRFNVLGGERFALLTAIVVVVAPGRDVEALLLIPGCWLWWLDTAG